MAPAIAGVPWVFMFSPSIGVGASWLRQLGMDWKHLLNSNQALALIVVAVVRNNPHNFLFLLARACSRFPRR